MLELKNLRLTAEDGQGKVDILKDVSLSVADGEFLVITGPNGGGKTSLAKTVMGLMQPSSGQIFWNGEEVTNLSITERARRGELDFKQALEERVGLLAGLDESVFERTFERVTFTPGALELVRSAHSKGWKVGVVSGGFHEVADKIVAAAGIDFCLANRLEVVDGKLTGKLAADIVTKESKLIQLLDWAVECGVDMAHTVAIGDGANDIPMIQAAGTGIAFCAKPKTREAAPFAIDERNLMLAMDIILRD